MSMMPSFVQSFYVVPSPKKGSAKNFVPVNLLFLDECQKSQGHSNLDTMKISPSHSENLPNNVLFELPPPLYTKCEDVSNGKTQTIKKKAWHKKIYAFWHGLHFVSKNKKKTKNS